MVPLMTFVAEHQNLVTLFVLLCLLFASLSCPMFKRPSTTTTKEGASNRNEARNHEPID